MKPSLWMRNPKGIEVEVDASRKDQLLKLGYREIEQPTSLETGHKIPLKVNFPSYQYPFGGYGRVVELLHQCFLFDSESKVRLYCGYPRPIEKEEDEKSILISMFEADKLPAGWKEDCGRFDLILVPTEWCKQVFIDSGVTQPIETIILGTDNFSVIQPNFTRPFKFLHYNAFSDYRRKGWDLVIKAFLEVFGRDESVELILKGRRHDNEKDIEEVPKQPNIRIVVDNNKREDLEKLQEEAHCFVFPSRGEGLGLPPIEMMARGVPTIVTSATGMKEYAELAIPLKTVVPIESRYDLTWADGVPGHWFEPSLDELKSLMWDVYKNYETYKYQAIERTTQLRERYSLDKIAGRFNEVVTKHSLS